MNHLERLFKQNNLEALISVDIECNGQFCGRNSILTIGAAAYSSRGDVMGTFEVRLKIREGDTGDPDTNKWWLQHRDALEVIHEMPERPTKEGFRSFIEWLEHWGRLAIIAAPVVYDGSHLVSYYGDFYKKLEDAPMFLRWPFLDMRSIFLGADMPQDEIKRIFRKHALLNPLCHVAVNDALEQGSAFVECCIDLS